MNTSQILEQAQDAAAKHVSGYGQASAVINGKTVTCDVVPGCRNAGARRKPSVRWSVDGKPVAAANLLAAIA